MSDHKNEPVDPTVVDPVGMGVSSERVGPTGPGQLGTDGVRDTGAVPPSGDGDIPPEQRPGEVEQNPDGLDPKAAYPSLDPRATDG
jgi:hypothetical protein